MYISQFYKWKADRLKYQSSLAFTNRPLEFAWNCSIAMNFFVAFVLVGCCIYVTKVNVLTELLINQCLTYCHTPHPHLKVIIPIRFYDGIAT